MKKTNHKRQSNKDLGIAKDRQVINTLNINGQMLPSTLLNILILAGNKWGNELNDLTLRTFRRRINNLIKYGYIKKLETGELVATGKGCRAFDLYYAKHSNSNSALQLKHRNLCHELFYRERIRLRAKSYLNEKQIRKYNYCIKNHVFPDFIVEKNIYEIELHDKGRRTTKKVMRLVNKFPNYKHIWYVRSDTNEGKRIAGNIAAAYKYLDITEAHYEIRKIK